VLDVRAEKVAPPVFGLSRGKQQQGWSVVLGVQPQTAPPHEASSADDTHTKAAALRCFALAQHCMTHTAQMPSTTALTNQHAAPVAATLTAASGDVVRHGRPGAVAVSLHGRPQQIVLLQYVSKLERLEPVQARNEAGCVVMGQKLLHYPRMWKPLLLPPLLAPARCQVK